MRARKAFIFTADAVLAFYLITVLLSILLIISYNPALYTQQSESLASDTLNALGNIRMIDVQGNPQYNYVNSLLSIQANSLYLWPMFERTTDHNVSIPVVYPKSNATWMLYQIGPLGAATGVHSTPIVYYGRVVMTSENGTYAYDENNGNYSLWPTTPIRSDSTPTTYSGHIFLNSLSNSTYSLDERGEIVWNVTFSSNILSSPVVHDGEVFVCLTNGSLEGFDIESGAALNWSFVAAGNITSTPAFYQQSILLFSSENKGTSGVGHLYSIDENSGSVAWAYNTTMSSPINLFMDPSPLVVNGIVYFTNEQVVDAVNATNGSEVFTPTGGWPVNRSGVTFTSSPVSDGNNLYIGCKFPGSAGICIIDMASQSLDSYSMGGAVYAAPVIANDSLIVPVAGIPPNTQFGSLMVVNKTNPSSVLWRYNIGQPIYSSPAIVNGRIYVGANDGNIYSFGNCSLFDSNMSVLEQIAAFWSIDQTSCAHDLAKEFLDSAIPQNFGFELVIEPVSGSGLSCVNGFGYPACHYCNGTVSSEWDSIYTNDCNQTKYQRLLLHDSRYISGISEKGSTIYYDRNPVQVELRVWN